MSLKPEHILSAVIYHSCTSTPLYQSAHNIYFQVPSFTDSKDTIGAKFKNAGHVTLTLLEVVCHL